MPDLVRFESFELDLESADLRRNGRTVRLPQQQFQILEMLLDRAGGVVTRDEIRKQLWPNDTVVEFDRSINAAIMKLRGALGDEAENPRFIETVARRGYRMLVVAERERRQSGMARAADAPLQLPKSAPLYGSLVGQKVAHYRVLGVLGGGGMGLVYKGEDLKLNRPVALKFLPEELATDAASLQRFEREARTASSLNHPNICTIYQVEEHDGHPFIVMELLEGETLREFIGRFQTADGRDSRRIPLRLIVEIAIHIAAGLEAAHENGIIHRDIKPANIFMTARGQIKILDFGLAKMAANVEAETDRVAGMTPEAQFDLNLSRTGTTMGTAGYMSPEQVRGEKLDARTDLFSFGLILYEMATGQRAFGGDTAALVQDAILHQTLPPVRELNPELPQALERLIGRALEKDREKRYATAAEMLSLLQELKANLEMDSRPEPARAGWFSRRLGVGVAAGLLILFALSGVWVMTARYRHTGRGVAAAHPVQMGKVVMQGEVQDLVFSPDGKKLAFTADGDEVERKALLTIEVGTSTTKEITRVSHGFICCSAWAPDGSRIAFIHCNGAEVGEVLTVAPEGGAQTKIMDINCRVASSSTPLGWTPDGSAIVHGDTCEDQGYTSIVVTSISTGERRCLDASEKGKTSDDWPRLSPDGSTVAFIRRVATTGGDVYVVPYTGGVATRLTHEISSYIGFVRWTPDGRYVVFSTRKGDEFTAWRVPVTGGTVERESENPTYGTVSPDGRLIASIETDEGSSRILSARLSEAGGKSMLVSEVTIAPKGRVDDVDLSSDGKYLVFGLAEKDNHTNLWRSTINGKDLKQLTSYDRPDDSAFTPRWSPDNKWIVFNATHQNGSEVSVMDADGNNSQTLSSKDRWSEKPSWSRDGKSVYYAFSSHAQSKTLKQRIATGEEIEIFKEGRMDVEESYDGKSLYYKPAHGGGLWKRASAGGLATLITKPSEIGTLGAWQVTENGIYLFDVEDVFRPKLLFYDFKTKALRTLRQFDEPLSPMADIGASRDGRILVFSTSGLHQTIVIRRNETTQ